MFNYIIYRKRTLKFILVSLMILFAARYCYAEETSEAFDDYIFESAEPSIEIQETEIQETESVEQPSTESQTEDLSLIEEISERISTDGSDIDPELAYRDIIGSPYETNAALLEAQNISHRAASRDFRFMKTEDYSVGILKKGNLVYDDKSEDATVVGSAAVASSIRILEDNNDGWAYIESGNVRGFAKTDGILRGEIAEQIEIRDDGHENVVAVINPCDNKSLRYLNTTSYNSVVNRVYAIAKNGADIKESKSVDSRTVGRLGNDGVAFILQDDGDDYLYVESGDVRGFVLKSGITYGDKIQKSHFKYDVSNLAEELIQPENNKALYYTLTSVEEYSREDKLRSQIVEFACQFVGNPYVWGGTSLTHGADCSGFCQSVYAEFGYSIPRVAADQAVAGLQLPVSEALPGDLVFYADSGYIYHVAMYIGDGMTVQAKGRAYGIVITPLTGKEIWATSIIQ